MWLSMPMFVVILKAQPMLRRWGSREVVECGHPKVSASALPMGKSRRKSDDVQPE